MPNRLKTLWSKTILVLGKFNHIPSSRAWLNPHNVYIYVCLHKLLKNIKARPYPGRTSTSMPSGIAKVQNRSLGSHSPKFAYFSRFSLIVLIMPHPTVVAIRHEGLPLVREGMWQSAIAGCVCLTHATINRIPQRHTATGTLVPGKSTGALRKTTPLQNRALCRMVQQDRHLSTLTLTA